MPDDALDVLRELVEDLEQRSLGTPYSPRRDHTRRLLARARAVAAVAARTDPAGEVREEWSVADTITDLTAYCPRPNHIYGTRERAERASRGFSLPTCVIHRTVTTGPWVPVDDTETKD